MMMVVAVILVSFALPKSSEKKRLPISEQPKPHATNSILSKKQLLACNLIFYNNHISLTVIVI